MVRVLPKKRRRPDLEGEYPELSTLRHQLLKSLVVPEANIEAALLTRL